VANARNANTYYIMEVSASGTATSFINEKNVQVTHIVFVSDAAGDAIVLNDKSASASSAGAVKLKIAATGADETILLDFSAHPIVFPNGIWVSSLSSNAVATLVGA
jgi:hypothetical protein